MLIAMAGLPGTGKSTLARRLAAVLPGIVLNKDRIRAALFPPAYIEYTMEQDDFCVSIMLQAASYLLRKDPDQYVILDGRTFSHRYQVDQLDQTAAQLAVPLAIIECVCSDATARWRLERAAARARHPAANRDYRLYLALKAHREPIREPKLVVNTDNDLSHCLDQCISYIKGIKLRRQAEDGS
jgi:predicted kinase